MYSVLIVDDDASARHGLSKCVAWKNMNAQVIGYAINGQEALKFVESHSVDIVLCDVCMPGMNGLELCQKLRERYPSIQILIISGYSEVDYLRTAIDVRAVKYILKPVKVTELETAVKDSIRLIEKERSLKEMSEKLCQSMPMLRERFLTQILEGTIREEEDIFGQASFLNFDLCADTYCVLLVSLSFKNATPMESQLHHLQLKELLLRIYKEQNWRGHIVSLSCYSTAIIDLDNEICTSFADELLGRLRDELSCDVDIGFGCEVNDVRRLPFSLIVARQALDQAYFEGHNRIFNAQPHLYETSNMVIRWDGGSYLSGALYRNKENVREYIDFIFNGMRQNAPARAIQSVAQQMLLTAMKLLFDCGDQGEMLCRAAALMADISQFDTAKYLQDAVWSFMSDLCDLLNSENQSIRQKLIVQIRNYIDAHYMENLRVRQIAEALHYSAAYLTTLFRKETGLTINEALTERRMKAAAELLRTTDLHIYEIADRVGYSDVKYFTNLFKKAYSMMPSEYRA